MYRRLISLVIVTAFIATLGPAPNALALRESNVGEDPHRAKGIGEEMRGAKAAEEILPRIVLAGASGEEVGPREAIRRVVEAVRTSASLRTLEFNPTYGPVRVRNLKDRDGKVDEGKVTEYVEGVCLDMTNFKRGKAVIITPETKGTITVSIVRYPHVVAAQEAADEAKARAEGFGTVFDYSLLAHPQKLAMSIADWTALFKDEIAAHEYLSKYYGAGPAWQDIREKTRIELINQLDYLAQECGTDSCNVILIRSPGRSMFIGTHTDRSYADGPTARFTINGKHVTVASVTEATATPRTPDKVIIRSKEYPQFEGSVRLLDVYERYGVLPLEDPSGLRKSAEWDKVAERIEEDVKPKSPATFLTGFAYLLNSYFVHNGRFDGPVITNGFDCSIYGNIQIGGGISSSSATVISMALALLAANNIKVLPPGEEADPKKLEISITDLKEIIGFAEWVAGTRGGTGDHGVIMYGDMGGIVHMWPDGRSQVLYLPSGMQQFLVQTPSRRYNPTLGEDTDEAGGTADARTVNRVYSYTLGYFLLRAKGSQITGDERFNQITCLADIVTLGIPPATVLEAFKALPDRVTREDIQGYIDDGVFSELPKGDLDNLMTYLENDSAWDSEGGICRVRRVTLSQTADLYRVIERFPQILKNTSLTDAEKNTAIRHLSEAVASSQRTQDYPDGTPATWNIDEITDDMLDEAIAGLEQGSINPKTQRQWDIAELPGLESYGVSSAYMDNMVDFIKEGLGEDADKFFAFMEGAGLGGSMLVFAAPDVVDKVKELYQRYAEENFNPGDISFEPMPTGRGAEAFVPPQAQAAARGATLDETVRRARERAAAIAAEQAAITERERVGIANIADRVVFGKDVKGFQGDFADSQFSGIQVPVDISTAVLLSVGITADSGLGVLEANIKGLPVGLLVKTEEQKRRIIALFPEVNPETVVSLEATNGNLNDAIGIALAALSRVYPNITSATYYFDEKTEQAAESSSFTFVDRTVNLSSYGLGIAEIRANLFQLFVGMGVPIGEITPADLATYDKAAALAQSI